MRPSPNREPDCTSIRSVESVEQAKKDTQIPAYMLKFYDDVLAEKSTAEHISYAIQSLDAEQSGSPLEEVLFFALKLAQGDTCKRGE